MAVMPSRVDEDLSIVIAGSRPRLSGSFWVDRAHGIDSTWIGTFSKRFDSEAPLYFEVTSDNVNDNLKIRHFVGTSQNAVRIQVAVAERRDSRHVPCSFQPTDNPDLLPWLREKRLTILSQGLYGLSTWCDATLLGQRWHKV
jgi:hypothetical protein